MKIYARFGQNATALVTFQNGIQPKCCLFPHMVGQRKDTAKLSNHMPSVTQDEVLVGHFEFVPKLRNSSRAEVAICVSAGHENRHIAFLISREEGFCGAGRAERLNGGNFSMFNELRAQFTQFLRRLSDQICQRDQLVQRTLRWRMVLVNTFD